LKKKQTDRLSKQQKKIEGPKGIFGKSAQDHDLSVKDISESAFESLIKEFTDLEFRYRKSIAKKEINEKLNETDSRLGVTIFVEKAAIKPDGGIIEVKDKDENWRTILVSEAKHQGKDIDNIQEGILVGKNKDQDIMVAGYAIECSLKACIARRIRRHDFPDLKLAKASYTHKLGALIRVAELDAELARESRGNATFERNWAVVKDWEVDARYLRRNAREANDIYSAITSRQHGVMRWLRSVW